MSKLEKYTLSRREDGKWSLMRDGSDRATKLFQKKTDAIRGTALEKALGKDGGSVKIQKVDGTFQEERTFPRSADPTKSPG
jgi:hypothetical protein